MAKFTIKLGGYYSMFCYSSSNPHPIHPSILMLTFHSIVSPSTNWLAGWFFGLCVVDKTRQMHWYVRLADRLTDWLELRPIRRPPQSTHEPSFILELAEQILFTVPTTERGLSGKSESGDQNSDELFGWNWSALLSASRYRGRRRRLAPRHEMWYSLCTIIESGLLPRIIISLQATKWALSSVPLCTYYCTECDNN